MSYKKPEMEFINLRSREKVADNCWHDSANKSTKEWFWDDGHEGYVKFTVDENCSGDETAVHYQGVGKTTEIIKREEDHFKKAADNDSKPNDGKWDYLKFNFVNMPGITDDPKIS